MNAGIRITAGLLRGRRIAVPSGQIRPTSEKARQAFFDIVGDRIEGAHFLDLFSGSGVFSFEAISRGAASAVAVDESTRAMADVARTTDAWQLPVRVVPADAIRALHLLGSQQTFDIVFADPPWDFPRYPQLLRGLDEMDLAAGAVVAIEHRRGPEPFDTESTQRLVYRRTANYGDLSISIFDGELNERITRNHP